MTENRVKKVVEKASSLEKDLKYISKNMFDNPEVSGEEELSAELLCSFLEKNGFDVERNYMDIKYAFRASFKSKKTGPSIAFLAEYDALPGIGHACGHNLIGTISSVAGVALSSVVDEVGGSIYVYGTPAEETNGAKAELAEKGAFDIIDVAMMAHPDSMHYKSGTSLALEAIRFEYFGKSAHAAAAPEEGINALDGAIGLFNGINALRQHIRSDARIHGVIKDGGVAANIVPDYACAEFYIRAKDKEYLKELSEKIRNCAKASALSSGSTVEISNYETTYDNMRTNEMLSNLYTQTLMSLGCENVFEPRKGLGSLDLGNVSHVCPSIHPYFPIAQDKVVGQHTVEFANCTITDYALEQSVLVSQALAVTGLNILEDSNVLSAIKEEFQR